MRYIRIELPGHSRPLYFPNPGDTHIQRTGADKILGLGGCHGDVLKIGNEWGGHVLNMGLFFFFF